MAHPTSYDLVPYESHAFPQTHPDRIAVIATLLGLRPAPPGRCRVLEIGCASGGNLIPLALTLPESTFLGIDLSQVQVAEGRATALVLCLQSADGCYPLGMGSRKTDLPGGRHGEALSCDTDR